MCCLENALVQNVKRKWNTYVLRHTFYVPLQLLNAFETWVSLTRLKQRQRQLYQTKIILTNQRRKTHQTSSPVKPQRR